MCVAEGVLQSVGAGAPADGDLADICDPIALMAKATWAGWSSVEVAALRRTNPGVDVELEERGNKHILGKSGTPLGLF